MSSSDGAPCHRRPQHGGNGEDKRGGKGGKVESEEEAEQEEKEEEEEDEWELQLKQLISILIQQINF